MTIFVNLAAFCEPLLEFTLDEIFFKSKHPNEIYVGLIDQTYDDNRLWLANKKYWDNIRYLEINPIDSRGVCWARSLATSVYNDEDFYLQIDSHTFFDKNWDLHLINELNKLKEKCRKPIISTYPAPFEFDDNGKPYQTLKNTDSIYLLKKHPETDISSENATLRFKVEHLKSEEDYAEGFHLAGGFIFTLGTFPLEIPYDPNFYFHGEEQGIALRAYTNGWKIFHPRKNLIPLYHLYKKKNTDYKNHHWHTTHDSQRSVKWTELKSKSDKRLIELITHKLKTPYGLGEQKTVEEFSKFSGIDYFGVFIGPQKDAFYHE